MSFIANAQVQAHCCPSNLTEKFSVFECHFLATRHKVLRMAEAYGYVAEI